MKDATGIARSIRSTAMTSPKRFVTPMIWTSGWPPPAVAPGRAPAPTDPPAGDAVGPGSATVVGTVTGPSLRGGMGAATGRCSGATACWDGRRRASAASTRHAHEIRIECWPEARQFARPCTDILGPEDVIRIGRRAAPRLPAVVTGRLATAHGRPVSSRSMYIVILAGGGGTRLWPLSRPDRPKPFLPLVGSETLLQRTVRRILPIVDETDMFVVADRRYGQLVRDQVPDVGSIVEPSGRNTAAAIALAARGHPATRRRGDGRPAGGPLDRRRGRLPRRPAGRRGAPGTRRLRDRAAARDARDPADPSHRPTTAISDRTRCAGRRWRGSGSTRCSASRRSRSRPVPGS